MRSLIGAGCGAGNSFKSKPLRGLDKASQEDDSAAAVTIPGLIQVPGSMVRRLAAAVGHDPARIPRHFLRRPACLIGERK